MYLYGSEHALMDYHLNPDKKVVKEGVELPELPVAETKESEIES